MATVIKAGRVIPSGTPVQHSEFNLEDMSDNASKYLNTVKLKAAQIVVDAQKQSKDVLAQAEQQGHQAAEEKAKKAALAEVETRWNTLAPALQQAVAGAAQLKASWLKEWENNIVRLVIGVSERVIRRELAHTPQISQQWIREALELASGSASVTLRLHPDDFAALNEEKELIEQQFNQLADATIVADPNISVGGCRVTTEYGQIDQQIEAQLARVEEELTT